MNRFAGAALVAVLLALTGCTPAATDAQTPTPTQTTEALSGTVAVFAAASLTETFDALADEFEAQHPGVDVVVNYGGSSTLAEQIVQGAPADVFAAANESTMTTVTDAGLIDDPTIFVTNTLEIVVPAGNPGGVTGLSDFAQPDLAIALCAAEVPCGAATAQAFTAAGVTPAPDTLEQDVKAVLTKVRLGEADAGLVYRTDVAAAGDEVEGIEFAEASSVVNNYPIGAVNTSANSAAASAFIDFVLSPDARRLFDDAGFGAAP